MQESTLNIEDILRVISGKLYLTKELKEKSKRLNIEEEYKNIITIVVEGLTSKEIDTLEDDCFLKKNKLENVKINKTDMNKYQEDLIKKLNERGEIKAYSFLPTGLGHYEEKKELINQIIRQTTVDEKTYIYVYLKDYQIENLTKALEKLTLEITNSLLVIIGLNEKEGPLIQWKKKEKVTDWIIRYPKYNEYHTFNNVAGKKYERLYKTKRKDVFISAVPYGQAEFGELCNPHQLRTLLIYEQNKEILGFIEAEIINTVGSDRFLPHRIMRIQRLYVVEHRRREKIGTRLFQAIWKKALKEKCSRLDVTVYHFTPEAKEFFESFGLNILAYQYEMKVEKNEKMSTIE